MKLLEHAMNIVEKVLERRMLLMVKVDEIQFDFRLREEYMDKEKKLYLCFVDLEKALDRVPRRVVE